MPVRAAIAKVRAELGREYDLVIGGKLIKTADKIKTLNPAKPSEVIGRFQSGSKDQAARAVETAHRTFATWSRTPAAERARFQSWTSSMAPSKVQLRLALLMIPPDVGPAGRWRRWAAGWSRWECCPPRPHCGRRAAPRRCAPG